MRKSTMTAMLPASTAPETFTRFADPVESAAMCMPFVSFTLVQALFGKRRLDAPAADPGAAADYARRAGCRLGADGEWIADDRPPALTPVDRRSAA